MTPSTFPVTFRVLPWECVEHEEVDALATYAETYWLPILHPTAFVLGRRLVALARRGDVFAGATLELDAYVIAHAIGVSERTENGHPSVAVYGRALKRLAHYRLVRIHGATVAVRDRWPRLNSGLLSALALPMQLVEPDHWANEHPPVALPEFVER